ncbi:MAG: hypothetical protein CVT99_08725 [Bacteroidetes bacterium HGW-Bacteroidetes-16]|nr:MAG: hypothetical protein CVT99_08725 [Bacteroidetes bacterium HGW-Bacteroidetes-16]
MKHNYQLFILSLIFISQSIFGQNYVIQEIPEWVKQIDIPIESSVSKYDISSGYYLTLVDYQANTCKQAIFSHEVINVVSYSGITAASQLSVSYDTTFQKLLLHHLYIWRKRKKIDRSSDLSFELLNSEDQLQQGIYTGQITAYDILNDIRKDDMIDFAYTLVGHNPIFENEKYLFFPLQMLNPIDLLNVRILFPKDKDYQYECVDCNSMDYSISNTEDYKVIEIKNENVKAIELEDLIPTWELPYKYFILSSFHSWAEVNMWAQRVFALNNDPDLDTVFKEIFTGEETTSDKINKIIDFVQDEIRYMGIESGMGSIKPFPPEQVVIQRFGDCKDKSLLLVSLLKKIGINTAYSVLVNTYMQQNVDKLFISNEVFNHTIVRFDYNDTTYWVDPTFAQQGGDFRDLYTPDYGKVLVIGMPADTLQTMSPVNRESGLIVTEEYFIKSFTEPSELKITSHRYGFEADQRRAVMEFFSTKDISDMIIKDMKLLFPMVNKKGEIEIADDLNNNTFTINYS